MNLLQRFLPQSLQARVFSLYVAALLIFLAMGLALFYRYQFTEQIEDHQQVGMMMMNVIAPSVGDSAVIGDYDTIAKTLDHAISGSIFSQAQFIDTVGGLITSRNHVPVGLAPPAWLRDWVHNQLFDVDHNIVVGGKEYGVLRLNFADDAVASELWRLVLYSMLVSLAAMGVGVVLIRIPLRRWLGNFDRVRAREVDILAGTIDVRALLDADAPAEIRRTFEILSRAAGRLSAQREEASVTLNAITDGVLTTDASLRLVYCNPAAEHMLGMKLETLAGRDVQSLLPMAFLLPDAVTDWKVRRIEVPSARSGQMIVDTTLSTIYAANNVVAGYVLACRDVTQQHALDQQLRSELQLRQRALESMRGVLSSLDAESGNGSELRDGNDLDSLIFRVVALMDERELGRRALHNQKFALDQHAIVSITNLQGVITYANDKFCEISGYSRAELLGHNHRLVNSGVHPAAFFDGMWQKIAKGQVWHGEICNRSKSAAMYWVDATIVPLLGSDGLPEQYIGIRTDITVRKTFEAKLAEQLKFVEVLLEAIPTAIYLKDMQGRYLRFNKAFEDLVGVERQDWIGRTVYELLPEDAANMNAWDEAIYANRKAQTYEASFTNRRTGERLTGLYCKAILTNAAGEPTGLVGTILDITEKNRFEQALREAKLSAEAANEAKGNFLANMSHEIRTPMNGVIGMTELALDTLLDPVQREYLETVKSSAQTLMVILNDILDFSKIEAGKLHIEAVAFSPAALIGESLKALQARARHKQLDLLCELPAQLPQRVLGDPVRIRQVLTNLCDNAIKFTSRGHVRVRVTCTGMAATGGSLLHFAIEDTGIGIAPEKQRGVFEAFSQADTSTTRKYGGTGLGLTICARLVELMAGRIWLESEPGQGSTFHFTVQVGAVAAPVPTASAPVAVSAAPAVRPLHVLLVEDHPINQLLATTLLKNWGHQVVLAENGQIGVDLFATRQWDLVLMDMQMPVMGGIEAARRIRAMEDGASRTPIVAMTANAMESDRQACLEAGMDDYIAKPFHATQLQALLARYAGAQA